MIMNKSDTVDGISARIISNNSLYENRVIASELVKYNGSFV